MSTDPATETDRELLDRLLPGWRIVPTHSGVYVFSTIFRSHEFVTESMAVADAARSLRAILARDRETRGEAKATPATPVLRRWPVQIVPYTLGEDTCFLAIANDGTLWETGCPIAGKWLRGITLPQPGEDGGA